MSTKKRTISSVKRLPDGKSGCPRWRVHFTDGTTGITASGAQVSYDIEALVGKTIHYVGHDAKGRIAYLTPEKEN